MLSASGGFIVPVDHNRGRIAHAQTAVGGREKKVFEIVGYVVDQRPRAEITAIAAVTSDAADFIAPRIAESTDDVVVASSRLRQAEFLFPMKQITIAAIHARQSKTRLLLG